MKRLNDYRIRLVLAGCVAAIVLGGGSVRADFTFGEPTNLEPKVKTSYGEDPPCISADGSTLYFASTRPPTSDGGDIWQVSIEPIVDFNGDDMVDRADMCIMIDYWGTGEQLCDIRPMPWGNGVVDVNDLIVLAEYLPTNINDVNDLE